MIARLALGAAALAVAALAALGGPGAPRGLVLTGSGAVRVENSREGQAILVARNMRPGQAAAGTVTVANRGRRPTRLSLLSSAQRGGGLGGVLRVTIDDGAGAVVADGTVAEVAGCHDLASLGAGESRTYRFTARFPRGDARDNGYAGSSASADERWLTGGCTPAVTALARPRVRISHRRVRLQKGRALVRIVCLAPAGATCTGTLTLVPRPGASRPTAVARASRFDVRAGRRGTVAVDVPRELRGRRRAVAAVVVRGRVAHTRRVITLIGDGTR